MIQKGEHYANQNVKDSINLCDACFDKKSIKKTIIEQLKQPIDRKKYERNRQMNSDKKDDQKTDEQINLTGDAYMDQMNQNNQSIDAFCSNKPTDISIEEGIFLLLREEALWNIDEVCIFLQIDNVEEALLELDSNQKMKRPDSRDEKGQICKTNKSKWMINRLGFFRLLLLARNPLGSVVRRWITNEVVNGLFPEDGQRREHVLDSIWEEINAKADEVVNRITKPPLLN